MKQKLKKWIPALLVLIIVAVGFACWARVSFLSVLPKGEWTNFRAAASDVLFDAYWMEEIEAEDVKSILERADVWKMDLRRVNSGYSYSRNRFFFEFTAEDTPWIVFIDEHGNIQLYKNGDGEETGFWRMEGSALDPEELTEEALTDAEEGVYYDGGKLYRLLVEKYGSPDTQKD